MVRLQIPKTHRILEILRLRARTPTDPPGASLRMTRTGRLPYAPTISRMARESKERCGTGPPPEQVGEALSLSPILSFLMFWEGDVPDSVSVSEWKHCNHRGPTPERSDSAAAGSCGGALNAVEWISNIQAPFRRRDATQGKQTRRCKTVASCNSPVRDHGKVLVITTLQNRNCLILLKQPAALLFLKGRAQKKKNYVIHGYFPSRCLNPMVRLHIPKTHRILEILRLRAGTRRPTGRFAQDDPRGEVALHSSLSRMAAIKERWDGAPNQIGEALSIPLIVHVWEKHVSDSVRVSERPLTIGSS